MKFCDACVGFILTPLMFLSGCSTFSDSDRRIDNNVVRSVPHEVASDGASARKKPTQYKPVVESNEPIEKVAPKSNYTVYTVQKGDTIYGIARKFEVSPATILSLNGLERESKLFVGQKINVESDKIVEQKPEVAHESTVYTVVPGDSLCKIAKGHGVSLNALRQANTLQSDKLFVGQKITIPADKVTEKCTTAGCAAPKPVNKNLSDGQYTVVQGDSLYIIAKKFGIKQIDLQRANNISDPNRLRVGQKLVIPDKTAIKNLEKSVSKPANVPTKKLAIKSSDELYTIKTGDTADTIAAELGVSKNDLIELNNLNEASVLQPGKKLLVPQKKVAVKSEVAQSAPAKPANKDFFDTFEEIPVVEINN